MTYLVALVSVLVPLSLNGQDDLSYIKTTVMTGSDSGMTTTIYVDGLGRESQMVIRQGSPCGDDIVTMREYDMNGRESMTWLATPINNMGGFCAPDIFRQSAVAFHGDSHPFTTLGYDGSPLGRKVEVCGAGAVWHVAGKSVKTEYTTNSQLNRCLRYEVSDNGESFSCLGDWQTGDLDVTVTTDEDGNKSLAFTDMRGLVVLQRQINATDNNRHHDTYYVYDNYGNLCFVLPPMASAVLTSQQVSWTEDSEDVDKYCFCYRYDARNLCISKKLPGCDPIELKHDKAHRRVFSQDGNLRAIGKSQFYAYDFLGREVVYGLCSDSNLPAIDTKEVTADYNGVLGNDIFGHTLNISLTNIEPLGANYFDFYDFLNIFASVSDSLQYRSMEGFDARYYDNGANSARGLLTGTVTRVLGDTAVLVKALYYDSHGNVIQSHESNALGGYDHYYYHLSFTGKPLAVRHEHSTASERHVDVTVMTRDAMERLLTSTITHDGEPVDVVTNTYDELGRLASQSCLNGRQTTAYSYNIHGWITGIDAGPDARSYPIMKQSLYYADATGDGATPCYNGNISAMDWNTPSPMVSNRYCYSYDGMNRLTAATSRRYYPAMSTSFDSRENCSTTYTYDLNSNLTSLRRYGRSEQFTVGDTRFYNYGLIDDLSITRSGNQLKRVSDQCEPLTYAGAMDFTDGADKATEYSWDANGNMTCDLNKGITKIKYNHLNLPEQITHSDGHVTRLTYAADGRKLRVRYLLDPTAVISQPGEPVEAGILNAGNTAGIQSIDDFMHPGDSVPQISNPIKVLMTRDYCGNYTYINGTAERVTLGNGFLQDSTYYVMITDYQGNVRAVLDSDCNLVERNEYYPYGGLINAGDSQLQPLKYSSKELDRQNGLDWYDFSARMYDSMLPQFTTIDAKAELFPNSGGYVYCFSNPIRLIDLDGNAPGDPFLSIDAAAKDFSRLYSWKSIKENKEIATYIYANNNKGKLIYSYVVPTLASTHNVVANESDVPFFSTVVGYAHTHGAYDPHFKENEFSGTKEGNTAADNKKVKNGDLGIFNKLNLVGYLSSPNGTLQRYNPQTGIITIIDTNMPSDPKDNTRKNDILPKDLKMPTVDEPSYIDYFWTKLKNIFK